MPDEAQQPGIQIQHEFYVETLKEELAESRDRLSKMTALCKQQFAQLSSQNEALEKVTDRLSVLEGEHGGRGRDLQVDRGDKGGGEAFGASLSL